ncbi:MAG TPA: kelch repeat-containing protein, partial [Thermoplasmata archaeon]|nr:kelch repeat-containing protein [Thermoplasmata archaeon]
MIAACVVGFLIAAGTLGVARLAGPSPLPELIVQGSAGKVNSLATPNGTWSSLGTLSPGRDGHGFVYDSKADKFILFGGAITSTGFTNSTWSYDYATNTWINITPRVSPPIRAGFGMVYDPDVDRVILFGGLGVAGAVGNPLADTWV